MEFKYDVRGEKVTTTPFRLSSCGSSKAVGEIGRGNFKNRRKSFTKILPARLLTVEEDIHKNANVHMFTIMILITSIYCYYYYHTRESADDCRRQFD